MDLHHFISINEPSIASELVQLAGECKSNALADKHLGMDKTLGLIFFNPSLRTRLSTQKAGQNLGMNTMVMNFSGEGWALETEDGAIMDGAKAEHIKEAAAVVAQYCDIVGIRSFPELKSKEKDYSDHIINSFATHSSIPIVNMESAIGHPLQALADMLTIEEHKRNQKPKVVLTWAPHPRALPQSVPNSFAQWAVMMGYEVVITHPEGYELDAQFSHGATIEHDQKKAFKDADFVYAKNWSSVSNYGQILSKDPSWTVDQAKMDLTNDAYFMHCLPVRRNVVVADEIIDSPNSLVIKEAANRVYSAQAVLKTLLLNSK